MDTVKDDEYTIIDDAPTEDASARNVKDAHIKITITKNKMTENYKKKDKQTAVPRHIGFYRFMERLYDKEKP